jgi:hypothetical protein
MMAPGQARPFVESEFVGRDEPLANLLKVARHETPKRILLVLGQFGIGKTWLLQKLKAEHAEFDITGVLIDFAVPPLGRLEWGYLDVVEAVREQLDGEDFAALASLVEAVRKEASGLGLVDPFATQMGAPAAAKAGDSFDVEAGDIGAGAQVAVGSNIIQAQGDVNFTVVNQLGQRTDRAVQEHYQARITQAFKDALGAFAAERKVTIVFDAWLKASTPTRDWLGQSLLAWVRDQAIVGLAAVLADDAAVPEFQGRHPLVYAMDLPIMTEAEIIAYWVEKRGLPAEKAPMAVMACMGHPLTLAMIADLHEMQGGL